MSNQDFSNNPLFTSEVVFKLPYSGNVRIDIPYAKEAGLVMDIYYPQLRTLSAPTVVIVNGYADAGMQTMIGKNLKELGWHTSWAKLLAASGFVAITYTNCDPEKDVHRLFDYLLANSGLLTIDLKKVGILSSSGNVPNALSLLTTNLPIRCAALCYGYMLDINGSTAIKNAQDLYHFVAPLAGKEEFPDKVPLLVVRAGQEDNPGLNESIDNFVSEALRRNAPLELINFSNSKHAFDILDKSKESVAIVRRILGFLQLHLCD
jgi:hypothetical protein